MQIISTNVSKQDDGKIAVEFSGEGGESITVHLAAANALEDGAAVIRAREMMVQVATFGSPDDVTERPQDASDALLGTRTEGPEETAPATGSFSSTNAVAGPGGI